MFTLSQTHNQAFQAKAEVYFVREVMQFLRENHAETVVKLPHDEFKVADLPEETLQKMVIGGIAKARSYGMTWQSTLISFVVIMFVSAPNFDEDEQIQEILEDNINFYPNLVIDALWDTIKEEIWKKIINSYNTKSWLI